MMYSGNDLEWILQVYSNCNRLLYVNDGCSRINTTLFDKFVIKKNRW
jgi:hypothetical protein